MKSALLVVVGIVIGGVLSFLLAPAVVGVSAGVGVATGLTAGACLTVEAAKQKGFITAEQVNEVLLAAGELISASASADSKPTLTGGDAECQRVVTDLKKAAQKK